MIYNIYKMSNTILNDILFSNLELSTITVEGSLSNIKFDLKETIEHLLYNVINNIKKINNIDEKQLLILNNINEYNLIDYLDNIMNNNFDLYTLIINELYNQNNTDKNLIKIIKLINEYNEYNKNNLIEFKEYCEKINVLSNTLLTIISQINDTNDQVYIDFIKLPEDINSIFKYINDNYQLLYDSIHGNDILKNYIELNNIINFNYNDVDTLYNNIFSNNIDKLNHYTTNIDNIQNITNALSEYCTNYIFLLTNINNIKKIHDEYKINKHKYFSDMLKLYSTFEDISIDFITLNNNINKIIIENKKEWNELNNFIVKIGCNYGEYISDTYKELIKKPAKSNRGRKPKLKKKSNRRKQGTGKYFTSQTTFTILGDGINDTKNKLYHIKIFVNGVIQIPSVTNEDINIVIPYIQRLITYFNKYINFIKVDQSQNININFIKSIMRNYKFYSFNETDSIYNIRLDRFKNLLLNNRDFINDGNDENYDIFPITEIKFNSERYPGLTIKFDISKEFGDNIDSLKKNKKPKRITVKLFSSGKINIDGANILGSAKKIQHFLLTFINKNKEMILYKVEDD